jgi:signal transduction histidine kinase
LIARTRRRLVAITLGLIALLVAGIGIATAWTGISALDGNVDRALQATADATLARLDGKLPTGSVGTSDGGDESDLEAGGPASADTFELYLGPDGGLVANPSRVRLAGLPDGDSVAAARAAGSDLRTVDAGGVPIRLLTEAIAPHETAAGTGAAPVGFLQVGFVLTLHDQQSADLIRAIVIVGLAGIAGAALITLYVTARALVPIRAAFEHERRFVADASHEIRTPTALIRASAEVVIREGLVGDAGRPLIDDVISESDRLARLVGDLLTLTSSGSGSLAVERSPIDLADVARDTVRRAGPLAEELGVELMLQDMTTSVDGREARAVLPILGDRDRLIQLLLILLDNAFGHSPPGGAVVVGASRDGRRAIVTVSDQGPGIPAEERERIFEPFARLGMSRSSGGEGSGLGLAIARAIVERHDGSIRVEDDPVGGARFVVSVPLA